jgi:hypothetical protein
LFAVDIRVTPCLKIPIKHSGFAPKVPAAAPATEQMIVTVNATARIVNVLAAASAIVAAIVVKTKCSYFVVVIENALLNLANFLVMFWIYYHKK